MRLPCGAARVEVGGAGAPFAAAVDRGRVRGGRPLRLRPCGTARGFALPAGPATLAGAAGPAARRRRAAALPGPGAGRRAAVERAGRRPPAGAGDAGRDGVRVDASGPSWLVPRPELRQGLARACDGRDLGAPRPDAGLRERAGPSPRRAARCASPTARSVRRRSATSSPRSAASRCSPCSCSAAAASRAPAPPPAPLPGGAGPARARSPRAAPRCVARRRRRRPRVLLRPARRRRARAAARPRPCGAASPTACSCSPRARCLRSPCRCPTSLVALLSSRGNPGGYDSGYANDRIAGHWLALAALTALGLVLWRTLASARGAPPRGTSGRTRPPSTN